MVREMARNLLSVSGKCESLESKCLKRLDELNTKLYLIYLLPGLDRIHIKQIKLQMIDLYLK